MAHGKGKSSSRPERDLEVLTRKGSEIEWNHLQKHHFQYIAVCASPTSSDAKPSESFPLIYPVPTESAACPLKSKVPNRASTSKPQILALGHPHVGKRVHVILDISNRDLWCFCCCNCLYTCNYTQSLLQVRHSIPVHPLCRAPELNSLFWCWNLIIHALKFFFRLWDGNWPKTTTIYPQRFIWISVPSWSRSSD